MAKSSLIEPFSTLEKEIIDTLIAGHHEWRPDLPYPQSHSDMQGAVRGLLRMFEVKRLPLPRKLPYPCNECDGTGYSERKPQFRKTCDKCNGTGRIEI